MAAQRKLTDEQEKSLLVGYLCSVPMGTITSDYSISPAMVTNNILRGRSQEWDNALVNSYMQVPFRERERNAMHLYLSLIGKDVENWNVVTANSQIAKYAFEKTESGIVLPKAREIAQKTGIETISQIGATPSDRLVRTVFGNRDSEDYVLPVFNRHAFDAFMARNYSWDAVGEATLQDVALRVRRGDFGNSEYKKQVMSEVLDTLTFRERKVLEARFGLVDGEVKSFEETARLLHDNPSRERIRQIEAKAVRKLQNPQRAWKIGQLDSLATDDEIKQRIALGPVYSESLKRANIPIDELRLGIRTRLVLEKMGISTVDQLTQVKTADLLSHRNFGETCLNELNEVLASYGVNYRF